MLRNPQFIVAQYSSSIELLFPAERDTNVSQAQLQFSVELDTNIPRVPRNGSILDGTQYLQV